MKNQKAFKSKVTSQPAEEFSKIDKENIISKYFYVPSTSFKTYFPTSLNLDMKGVSDPCVSMENCELLDEDTSEISQKDPVGINQDTLRGNFSASTASMGAVNKNSLNETLDDFQECEIRNRVKSKLAEKNQEDSSFICMMCQADFTHLTLDERTLHVNQCIDYHSSAVATSQTVPTTVFVLECPLCFKSLPSNEARKSHVKKCGKSRGLSVQSVIQAINLQEKHILERKALGLPVNLKSKPVKPPKKPSVKNFKLEPKSAMQSDLQLAKALSLSLKQNETNSQLTILPTSNEDVSIGVLKPPAEFQNPGRPPSKKKKGVSHTPLLLLRTEDERNKIMHDKVDAIVVSSLKCEKNPEDIGQEKTSIHRVSTGQESQESQEKVKKLKNGQESQEKPYLWNLSSTSADKSMYYVEQLLDWIKPSNVEVGSKLCNLSQVPGHRIFTQLPCDYTFSCANKSDETDITQESNSAPSLTSSLRSLIGNSWMSDVDIHTASGIVIPAHKLFLALRCPALKNAFDAPIECGKYILNWENTSFDAALHFLNFIYTGSTEWKEEIIGELTQLAKKYNVKDLLDILNDSETLELLISEEPETQKSVDTSMDTGVCDKNNGRTVGYMTTDNILEQRSESVAYNTNQIYSTSNDKDLEVSKDINMKSKGEKECTVIEMNNFSYSSSATNFLTAKTCLDISNGSFMNMKEHNPNFEACISDSNSSDDSCKILRDSAHSEFKTPPFMSYESMNQMSPKISLEKEASTSYLSLKSPSKTYLENSLAKNASSPDLSINKHCKNSFKDIYISDNEESISSKFEDDKNNDNSNEDIFIVKEFKDKSDSIQKQDSFWFNNSLHLDKPSQKLSSFSSMFQNECEDLDAAICLSQNTSFQNQSINSIDNCANKLCEKSLEKLCDSNISPKKPCDSNISPIKSVFQKNSWVSPEKLHFNQNCNKQYLNSNISPIKNDSFYNDSYNSNKMDCFDYDKCEMNNVTSPEILVCDSDEENDELILGSNYFKKFENLSQNLSSPPKNKLRESFLNGVVEKENSPDYQFHYDSNINWRDKSELETSSKENVFSPNFTDRIRYVYEKESAIHNETSISSYRSPNKSKDIVPELICCDSNSDDKLEVMEASSSSSKKIVLEDEDCISVFTSCKTIQHETPKNSPCKNLLLSSPESPWTFKVDGPSEDFIFPTKTKTLKSSSVSSQLHSKIELKYTERKGKDSKTLDKDKANSINTPKDLLKYKISDSPITPFPDYGKMISPEIKEALKKIGVKALPRKKAVAVLSHIYDEIHPWNDGASSSNVQHLESTTQSKPKSLSQKKVLSLPKKRKETTEICKRETKKRMKKSSNTTENQNEVQDKASKKTTKSSLHNKATDNTSPDSLKNSSFGSINSRDGEAHNISISSEFSDSGLPECKENTEILKNYILSKDDLYNRILNYMPINLLEFQQELKENGIKITVKQLKDYLDEQCITFTCPRKEEVKKKQQERTQRFRKKMIAKLSQQGNSSHS